MKKAIIAYETSLGPQIVEIENAENIFADVDEKEGVVYIKEKEDSLHKTLAIISLKSFVSFNIESSKEEDSKLEELCKAVSDCLFENKDKYNPYTKVVITDEEAEINEGTQAFIFKRNRGE